MLAIACLALGGVGALEARQVSVTHGEPLAWTLVLASTMPRWVFLAAVLPFVLRYAMRTPVRPLRFTALAGHTGVFLAVSVGQALLDTWALRFASPVMYFVFGWRVHVLRDWFATVPMIFSIFVAVHLAAWGMAEARERQRRTLRTVQLEAQLQSARLESLRARLQPHFLYNTLNGIAALVADVQPGRAVVAIEQLAELLQASLRDDGREDVTIAEEMALAEKYLALQGMRFAERLRYELRTDPAVAEWLVPVFLLQPVVENAVVHGLESGQERLHVSIVATAAAGGIEIRIENDGTTFEADATPSAGRSVGHGVGLAATRARLITAYGDDASLRIAARAGGGAVVTIVLPLRGGVPVVIRPAATAPFAVA